MSFSTHLRHALASFARYYASLGQLRDRRVATLGVANLLDSASSSIIVPLLPLYAESLGVGPFYLGLLFALPTAVKAVVSPAAGYLSDRTTRTPWMVGGMALGGASVVALAFASQPWLLLALRGIDGFAAAVRNAPTTAYLGDIAPAEERGQVMGAYRTMGILALAAGPAMGGGIATVAGLGAPFLVLGGFTLFGGLALTTLPRVAPQSDDGVAEFLDASAADLRVAATPSVLALGASAVVAAAGTNAMNPLLAPLLAATVDAGPTYVSLAWSSFGLGMALFIPVGGTLADRAGRVRSVVAGKLLWTVVVVGLVVGDWRVLPPALLAVGGVASALVAPALGALRYETAPADREGSLLGVYGALGSAGATAGPLVGGAVADLFGVGTAALGVGVLWALDAGLVLAGVEEPAVGSDAEPSSDAEPMEDDPAPE